MLCKLTTIFTILGVSLQLSLCQVIELDDSFEEKKLDKPWLVMFYAPWCGHCKKLEPTFAQVHKKLKEIEPRVRVAKLDATRYQSVASAYNVRGYPTVKFIEESNSYTYNGDRSTEGIIEFTRRAHGPSVRPISNTGKFNDFRSDHSDQVFFFYMGIPDQFNALYKKYESLADKYATLSYFCVGERRVLPAAVTPKHDPAILVFKDSKYYEFQADEHSDAVATNSALEDFVNGERFPAFPKVLGGNLNEFSELKKKVVIIVVEEKEKSKQEVNQRFKDMGELLATRHRYKYHSDFQFIWMGDKDTIDSVTMMDVKTPFVIVLDPVSQYYYLPIGKMADLTLDTFEDFLKDVREGKSPPFGGTGFSQRVKRIFFDIYVTIHQIYEESVWLALLIFGIPSVVISFVCYALCCMEPFDEEQLYNDSDMDDYDDDIDGGEGTDEKKPLLADGHMKKE